MLRLVVVEVYVYSSQLNVNRFSMELHNVYEFVTVLVEFRYFVTFLFL